MKGALTLGDLDGRLEWLEVSCANCPDRRGRYRVAGLIAQYGAAKGIPDWLETLRVSCPTHQGASVHARCKAGCPQLVELFAEPRNEKGPRIAPRA